jgi:hypothetical protein
MILSLISLRSVCGFEVCKRPIVQFCFRHFFSSDYIKDMSLQAFVCLNVLCEFVLCLSGAVNDDLVGALQILNNFFVEMFQNGMLMGLDVFLRQVIAVRLRIRFRENLFFVQEMCILEDGYDSFTMVDPNGDLS